MSDLITWHAPYTGWLVLATLAVLGLLLVRIGLRRRVVTGPHGCPRCGYDIRFSPSSICSECGHDRLTAKPIIYRRWWLVPVGLIIAIGPPTYVVQMRLRQFGRHYYECFGPIYWMWPRVTLDSCRVADYRVVVSKDRRTYLVDGVPVRVDVYSHGESKFSLLDWDLKLGWSKKPFIPHSIDIPALIDLDHDGVPELIIHRAIGGYPGAEALHIVSLDPTPRVWDPVDRRLAGETTESGEPFCQVASYFFRDADGSLLVGTFDHSFVYWKTSYADSPFPRVILRPSNKRLIVALDKMIRPLPPPEELDAAVAECQKAGWVETSAPLGYDPIYPPLLKTMLNLIHTGHSAEAYAFAIAPGLGRSKPSKDFSSNCTACSPNRHTPTR